MMQVCCCAAEAARSHLFLAIAHCGFTHALLALVLMQVCCGGQHFLQSCNHNFAPMPINDLMQSVPG